MRPWLDQGRAHNPAFIKANMGCGTLVFNPDHGWLNFDQFPVPERGVLSLDLCQPPYDIRDNALDYILFSNILEHIPQRVPVYAGEFWYVMLEELLRITRAGGFWEIHGPDPRDAVYTLQVGGHTRLVGPHTFHHLTVRYNHGAIRTTALHDSFGAELLDVTRYPRLEWGKVTDWHLKRYLGRPLGDFAGKVLGHPGQIRMVLRIIKGARS